MNTLNKSCEVLTNDEEGRGPIMSIMKITQSGVNNRQQLKSKWTTLANILLLSIIMLSALDLFLASVRDDSLSNFTMYVLIDLMLTVLALIFSIDLVAKGKESIVCFLVYMLFLWTCITILKSIFQL